MDRKLEWSIASRNRDLINVGLYPGLKEEINNEKIFGFTNELKGFLNDAALFETIIGDNLIIGVNLNDEMIKYYEEVVKLMRGLI